MTAERCVVVGYDGSKEARLAVAWAARTARGSGTRLRVVHAVGLLEYAGLAGHAHVEGDDALKISSDAGLDPGEVEWHVVDGDPCRPCSAWPSRPRRRRSSSSVLGVRAATPARCSGAPASSWPSTPRSR